MCGIFGVVRNAQAAHPERATAVLAELGHKSVSRGRDSAGLAFIPAQAAPSTRNLTDRALRTGEVMLDEGIVITKATSTFSEMWKDETHIPMASVSAAIIGHTRAATQGSRTDLANVSPMAVGTVVGTHNGDIDKHTVSPWTPRKRDAHTVGGTDTEHLYRAIDSVSSHRKKITEILERAHGRVALAWMDRRLPHRIYLARGGLSPLCIAFDREGNMYWASGSDWFREIDAQFGGEIGFDQVFMVPEGTLITVDFAMGKPSINDMRTFVPAVRASDNYAHMTPIIWRGVHPKDAAKDRDSLRHRVIKTNYGYGGSTLGSRSTYSPSTSPGAATVPFSGHSPQKALNGPVTTRAATLEEREGWNHDSSEYDREVENPWNPVQDETFATNAELGLDDPLSDAFDHYTNTEVDEAFRAVEEFIEKHGHPQSGETQQAVINVMMAFETGNLAQIARDHGLPTDASADLFIELLMDEEIYQGLF